MKHDYAGIVALVTGAAGGIGAAVVRALAERGAAVAAVDLPGPALENLAAALTREKLTATVRAADVSSRSAVEALVEAVERDIGPIDALVNVAGVLRVAPALALTDEDWEHTFAVNVHGVVNVSRAVATRMVARRRGAVVTVTSNAAAVPRMGMAAYGASKAAAGAFTKCLGLEVAPHGVRCNVVAPGSTDTEMLRSLWTGESGPQQTLEGSLKQFRVGIPLGKLAQPSDIVETVLFLLSRRAGHITMQDIFVDGGAALGV